MAFFNVIIPVYNAKKFIYETIQSVLGQPYKDIHIVLIDDGSIDGSSQLCDDIAEKEKRISVIHQKNSGVSTARNVGLKYVLEQCQNPSYIAFLDSDDLWFENVITIEKVNEIIEENADIVGFSMCSSNPQVTKAAISGEYNREVLEFPSKFQIELLWPKGSFATHFYHSRIFLENNIFFDSMCKMNEDVIFSTKMFFCAKKFMFYDSFLYIYRKNRMSVTSTTRYNLDNATHIPEAWFKAAEQFDDYIDMTEEDKCNWRKFCLSVSSMRCLEMIRMLSENGYSLLEIDTCFQDKLYYANIVNLSEEDMSEWQRNDLKIYKQGIEKYYAFYKRKRIKRYVRNMLCSNIIAQNLIDNIRYRIPIEEIKLRNLDNRPSWGMFDE